MKFKKNVVVIFFLLLFQSLYGQAQRQAISGIELSNTIFSFLQQEKFQPITQSLLNNGENAFPYNIFIKLDAPSTSEKNLILIFPQEQTIQNKHIILETLNYVKKTPLNTNIIFLFSYGDKQTIEKHIMIYGSEVFINSLNTNEDYTAIYCDLDTSEHKIITSSNGKYSPSYLIQNEYNIFHNQSFTHNLPHYFVSQMNSLKLYEDKQLALFFENEIPAIKLCINTKNTENEKCINTICASIKKFDSLDKNERLWEKHFIIVNIFGNYVKIGEASIIRIIIFILFIWMILTFILGLKNFRLENTIIYKIKKSWFIIPLTLVITYMCFIIGKNVIKNISPNLTSTTTVYFTTTIQLSFSLFIISLIYLCILMFDYKITTFTEKTTDFNIVIACLINLSIFIFFDISLFPLFVLIFLLSIFAYFTKHNITHWITLFLIICILSFYANGIVNKCLMQNLKSYILENRLTPIILSLIIYPIYLLYFRFLISIKNIYKKNTTLMICSLCTFIGTAVLLITFSAIRIKYIQKSEVTTSKTLYTIKESSEEKIHVKYTDKFIFTDIIRTVTIDLEDAPEVCDVRINSTDANPVLYSDNDFENLSANSVVFKIPENPPSKLIFSYGSNNKPCNIVITALYSLNNSSNEYKKVTKVVSINEL